MSGYTNPRVTKHIMLADVLNGRVRKGVVRDVTLNVMEIVRVTNY